MKTYYEYKGWEIFYHKQSQKWQIAGNGYVVATATTRKQAEQFIDDELIYYELL